MLILGEISDGEFKAGKRTEDFWDGVQPFVLPTVSKQMIRGRDKRLFLWIKDDFWSDGIEVIRGNPAAAARKGLDNRL